MILKKYQEKVIDKLLQESNELLRHRGKKLILKAPTGSGKTIMMAEFLKRFVQQRGLDDLYSFIWIAPRQLHLQSKEKLENYFEDTRALRCSLFEDLDDKRIGENEILFFNWESINRKEGINLYIRENEQEFYLSKVLDNTREEGCKIILVIDESHFSTDTENANNLKEMFDPELTIEVSATPAFIDPDGTVNVDIEDVKEEGMIKKSIILNDNINNVIKNGKIISAMSKDADELVLEEALKKRKEIVKAFKIEGKNINPLVVIQLPSRIRQEHEDLKNNVIRFLNNKFKINTVNNKLGIYLSEEHVNIEDISKNDNETEVLLFKQGIAIGWDCPRAHILVLFREWHSEIFSIQTVGRIMRMPEPDIGHYDSEIINHAYVYTNLSNITLSDDIAKDYITIYTSKRKKVYKNIDMLSYYSLRQREKTRLSPLFIKLFLEIAEKNKLKEKVKLRLKDLTADIISDWEIENINLRGDAVIRDGGTVDIILDEMQQQLLFDHFVVDCLKPLYPEERSVGRVKEAIYNFFDKKLKMKYEDKQEDIIKIVLSDQNMKRIKDVIDETKEKYIEEVTKREKEIKEKKKWNIPESIRFNENYHREDYKKCIMEPFFIGGRWKTEKAFIEYIESNSKNIEWWFKNGDRDAVYFAVPYEYEGESRLFYVDFIIKFKDGRIGLFDTKSGITIRDSKEKSDGLQEYIKNNKPKKVFGGIVTNTDKQNYNGRWLYFDRDSKDLSDVDWSNWKNLELLYKCMA